MDTQDRKLSAAALGPSRIDVSPGKVLRCRVCRFGFRQMRGEDEELSRLYRDLDSSVYQFEFRGRSKTAVQQLTIVRRYLSPGYLLDVGCASGLFLRCATDAGWNVIGVEPSKTLCNEATTTLAGRGEVICATLQNSGLHTSSFDAVTIWDVLEHVRDPIEFMNACGALLKPGGHLFVNVPNLDSLQARILGARWPLLLPEHLNYFNRKSLKFCGECAKLTWLHFGRRRAYFSLKYVFYRLAQHQFPGASIGNRLMSRYTVSGPIIPLSLGELYGVWRREHCDSSSVAAIRGDQATFSATHGDYAPH
jgi:SAM-dependent methyltransferase